MRENVTGTILPEVQRMIDNPGMYLVADKSGRRGECVAIWSSFGKLYSMKPDIVLNPLGWFPGNEITGPLTPPCDPIDTP